MTELPVSITSDSAPVVAAVLPTAPAAVAVTAPTITRVAARPPKLPALPDAAEARAALEGCLVGLERAVQDREMLQAPDLRAVVNAFIESIHDVLSLDEYIERGKVNVDWLRDAEALQSITRLCFRALWPAEGMLLPPTVQAWVLAVDDVARRWQYARRRWFADACGFTIMPIVPGLTTINSTWHAVTGVGNTVAAISEPGFLLRGEVLRKAQVSAN